MTHIQIKVSQTSAAGIESAPNIQLADDHTFYVEELAGHCGEANRISFCEDAKITGITNLPDSGYDLIDLEFSGESVIFTSLSDDPQSNEIIIHLLEISEDQNFHIPSHCSSVPSAGFDMFFELTA